MTLADRLGALTRALALDLTPLRVSRDYRFVFVGQFVSFFGSMVTFVAVPYQVYLLTKSSLLVGLLGAAELIPVLALALVGGALADSIDRRRLVVLAEVGLSMCCLVLAINALGAHPSLLVVYVLAGVMAGLGGLHRPALESMTPRLLPPGLMPAAAALGGLRGNLGMIGGPALGGLLIATVGLAGTYLFDVLTFLVSLVALLCVGAVPPPEGSERPSVRGIREGLEYAMARPVLLGTYLVDINAMIFGMPMALFPAIAETHGGGGALGFLYGAPAVGALVATLTSGWTPRVSRHGLAIALSAAVWGLGIVGFGLAGSLTWQLAWLAVAGGADMVSGIFRSTIWNQTIPDRLRGRLAGIEQISYLSGPLLGHVEAGLVASVTSVATSIISGGVIAVAGTAVLAWRLPALLAYRADRESCTESSPKS